MCKSQQKDESTFKNSTTALCWNDVMKDNKKKH